MLAWYMTWPSVCASGCNWPMISVVISKPNYVCQSHIVIYTVKVVICRKWCKMEMLLWTT